MRIVPSSFQMCLSSGEESLSKEHLLPPHSLLIANVPPDTLACAEMTRQGIRCYPGRVESRVEPMDRPYYWLGGDLPEDELETGTDVHAVANSSSI